MKALWLRRPPPGTGRSSSRLRLETAVGIAAAVIAVLAILALGATEWFLAGGRLGDSNLQSINGTVFFRGRPIPEGSIEFVPQVLDSTAADFTPSWAEIRNGEFAHKGLGSGVYLLRIRSELVETHQRMVGQDQLEKAPAPGRPSHRTAPVIEIKPDARNYFEIRFE